MYEQLSTQQARPMTGLRIESTASRVGRQQQPGNSTTSVSTLAPGSEQRYKRPWSREEDDTLIDLRGQDMSWKDISRQLTGRSDVSCRLHYQNYLERSGNWSDDKRNEFAETYER